MPTRPVSLKGWPLGQQKGPLSVLKRKDFFSPKSLRPGERAETRLG